LKKALAGEQDPVFHYRIWKAKEKAEEVNHDLAIGNILDAVWVSFWQFGWAREVEDYLGFCVDTLHSDKDSYGGCRMLFYDMTWEGSRVPIF
jgi:hypothetical protein